MRPYKITATFLGGEVREVVLRKTTCEELHAMLERSRFLQLEGEWWNTSKIVFVRIEEAGS